MKKKRFAKVFSVSLDEPTYIRIKELSTEFQVSMSDIVRRIISDRLFDDYQSRKKQEEINRWTSSQN